MKRIFLWFILFLIGANMLMHYFPETEWVKNYVGRLPGDYVVVFGNTTIYLPFVSALLVSIALSFLCFLIRGGSCCCSRKHKDE